MPTNSDGVGAKASADGGAEAGVTEDGDAGGDTRQWSGSESRIEGEDLLIMKESDVLGIIQGGQRGTEGRLIASEPSPLFETEHDLWPPNS